MSDGIRAYGKNYPTPATPPGVVCFQIVIPDAPEYRAALLGQIGWLADWRCWKHTQADYTDPPSVNYEIASLFASALFGATFGECGDEMNCDELIACLTPLFEGLQAQITAVSDGLETVQNTIEDNAAQERPLNQSVVSDEVCGAARGVVEAMDSTINGVYANSEASWVDSALEKIPMIIRALPLLGELPFDEMFELVNWMFEHQAEVYQVDYSALKEQMICDLACYVQINGNNFTWDVWNDWLLHLGETYPDNSAAQLFARFAPARQTWVNQIAQLINKNNSLQAFFDTLSVAWDGGLLLPEPCVDCDCPSCGIGYTVVIGAESMDGDVVSDATAMVTRLDIPPATAYARRIAIVFDSPVAKITLGWNTEGAADDMYASLDGSAAQLLVAPAGSNTLTFPAGTTLVVDLGYSGDSGAYAGNPARIHINDACE